MIDPLLGRTISLALALLLLLAAWHKVAARDRFTAALGEYRLLPAALLPTAVVLIAGLEAGLGLAWLAGHGPGAVALLTAALLATYAAAIAINLGRGRAHISCGCEFGGAAAGHQPLSWWLVARNLLLGAVAVVATVPATSRDLGPYDWLTMTLALVAAGVLSSGTAQLLRNGAALASWRRPRD